MEYSCLPTILLIKTLLVLHQRDGSLLGKSKLIVVLNIVCRILLSIRTTAKGAGPFYGIQESCLLIIISLLIIIVIPKGTGAFGGLKIVFANCTT